MIQTSQQSLSESEIGTLKEWLTSAGAELFLKVMRAEQALLQAEAGWYYMAIDRQVDEKKRAEVMLKAKFSSDRADELQWLLDKFSIMRDEENPYEFKTITLTP